MANERTIVLSKFSTPPEYDYIDWGVALKPKDGQSGSYNVDSFQCVATSPWPWSTDEKCETLSQRPSFKKQTIDRSSQENNNQKIERARRWYDEINKDVVKLTKVINNDIDVYKDLNSEKYSYESTEIHRSAIVNLERYYSDGKLVKAVVKFEGDRTDLTSEYYFHNQQLFFVFKTKIEYDKPKWDSEFDPNKKNILENRFYFDSVKLIRWIDSDKKIRKSAEPEFKTKEHQILSDASLYREIK